MNIAQALQKHFLLDEFRAGQEEVIASILAGRDTLALMPTGGGKSLCYQLPAMLLPHLTIVVSPLIALMQDQVDSLHARGISATYVNSTLDATEQSTRLDAVRTGDIKILYIAPERFGRADFREWFHSVDISLIAVDEAHCISQWGHDFRPDYRQIPEHIAGHRTRPVVAAFTATATPEVTSDITERLALANSAVFVRGFDRPNLQFFVRAKVPQKERADEALRMIGNIGGAGVIYVLKRTEAEKLAKFLKLNGVRAACYHAGMDASTREQVQKKFMDNQLQVIVATVAFGMGVDKADIRFVIHVGMPGSLEGYYQEAGRAGRDGEKAYCILLHNGQDANLHSFFIRGTRTEMMAQGKNSAQIASVINTKYRQLDAIKEYVSTVGCRRRVILDYFGDTHSQIGANCGGCDNCLGYKWKVAQTTGAKRAATVKQQPQNPDELSGTILETVTLYAKGKSPNEIARIRSLAQTTIMGHLATWYTVGGDFRIDEYLAPADEKLVRAVLPQIQNTDFLKPIKSKLPDSISYETIRLVIAKVQHEAQE